MRSFRLELGVQVVPELALGAAVGFSFFGLVPGQGYQAYSYSAQGFVEGALMPGEVARPFARVLPGVAGEEPGIFDGANRVDTTCQFGMRLELGVHLFADPSVSISPFAGVSYAAGRSWAVADGLALYSQANEFIDIYLGVELVGWSLRAPARLADLAGSLALGSRFPWPLPAVAAQRGTARRLRRFAVADER